MGGEWAPPHIPPGCVLPPATPPGLALKQSSPESLLSLNNTENAQGAPGMSQPSGKWQRVRVVCESQPVYDRTAVTSQGGCVAALLLLFMVWPQPSASPLPRAK